MCYFTKHMGIIQGRLYSIKEGQNYTSVL
jgi:hypothetical protein